MADLRDREVSARVSDLLRATEFIRTLLIDLKATLSPPQTTINDLIKTCYEAGVNLSELQDASMEGAGHDNTKAAPPIGTLLAQHLRNSDEKAASDRLKVIAAHKTLCSIQSLYPPLARSISDIRETIPTLLVTTDIFSIGVGANHGDDCLKRLKQHMLVVIQCQHNVLEPFLAKANQNLTNSTKLFWDVLADDEKTKMLEEWLSIVITSYESLERHNKEKLEELIDQLCAYHLRPHAKKLQTANDQLIKYHNKLENWREHIPKPTAFQSQ
ncbi:uncharacterized protein IWZ02DRAFT_159258 [Phyllosticta citriasiana]|uniref:uncharacterized protein n=1 Tax=Phyllosticta citriasiana TaxID=595635 RepID=UPI0030FD6C7A